MSIKLRNIIIDYGNSIAVDDLSLLIETGELVSLLGPSGCGKSTTLNAIAGLIQVTQGQIIFDGIDVTKKSPQKRNIGLVFQNYALYPHLSVFKNIAFPLYQNKNFKFEIKKNNVLAKLEIAKIKRAGVHQKDINFQKEVWSFLKKYVKNFINIFQKIVNVDLKKIKKIADKYAVEIYGETTLNAFRTRQFITWYDDSRSFIEEKRLEFYDTLMKEFDQILEQLESRLKVNNVQDFQDIKFLFKKEVDYLKIEDIYLTKNRVKGIKNAVKGHQQLMVEERKAAERLAKLSSKDLEWKVTKEQHDALKNEYEEQKNLWRTNFETSVQTFFANKNVNQQLIADLTALTEKYNNDQAKTKISQQEFSEKIVFWNKQIKSFNKVVKASVLDVAQKVEITSQLKKKPSELSGGQQQRVAIARAIVKKPKVLLLDEPLSNLDAKLRVSTREWIKKFQKDTGITTIFVTHDQEEAMSISDKIFVMSQGVLQQADTPINIYNNPANQFVANFIGTPSMNFFEGQIDSRGNVTFDDIKLGTTTKKELHNKKIVIGVRPEHIELLGSNTTINKANNKPLKAKIDLIERLGRSDYIKALLPNKNEVRIIYDAKNMELDPKTKEIEFNIMKNKVFLFEKEGNKQLLEVI